MRFTAWLLVAGGVACGALWGGAGVLGYALVVLMLAALPRPWWNW